MEPGPEVLPAERDRRMSSERFYRLSRRKFLASAATLALTGPGESAPPNLPHAKPPHPDTRDRKPLAVLATVYRPMSHAYHIAGRFLLGYPLQGTFHIPKHYVKTLYVDQRPDNDQSRELA